MVSGQPLGILESGENRPQPTGSVEVLGHMSTKKSCRNSKFLTFCAISRWHSQPPGAASLSVAFAVSVAANATGRCQSLGGIRSRRAWLSLPLSCAALSSALSRTTKRNFLSLILSRAAKRTFLSRSFPCNEMELFHPVLSRQRSAGLPEASKIL